MDVNQTTHTFMKHVLCQVLNIYRSSFFNEKLINRERIYCSVLQIRKQRLSSGDISIEKIEVSWLLAQGSFQAEPRMLLTSGRDSVFAENAFGRRSAATRNRQGWQGDADSRV